MKNAPTPDSFSGKSGVGIYKLAIKDFTIVFHAPHWVYSFSQIKDHNILMNWLD